MIHWGQDFFTIERFYLYYMDLLSEVYGVLRLDYHVGLKMEGNIPRRRGIQIVDNSSLLRWVMDNRVKGDDYLYLYVERVDKLVSSLSKSRSESFFAISKENKEPANNESMNELVMMELSNDDDHESGLVLKQTVINLDRENNV
ncbi:hypothetical protein RJT34_05433 [Clitoria ternatea]|uniref:Uncharacterized protein n=1 Tax=Clitoria ternatea TaxID=43366 RepID=A0AAN9K3P7_CLITE